MKLRWAMVALLLLGQQSQAGKFPVEIIEQFDNARVVAFIQDADLADSPAWDPMSAPPPLSVAEAIEAVKNRHANGVHKAEPLTLEEIELRKLSQRDTHWHYLLKIRQGDSTRYYVVLMNGKVIAALQEPEAYK